MSASAFESPQHPSRGKRSVSFSCPTPLRPASTASTPLTRSATFGSSSQSPIHSRSLSWNTVSTSSTEGRGDKVVAWEDGDDEGDFLAGSPIRWNKALAERLELVERELKHHQKKWSAGQEDFHHEVPNTQESTPFLLPEPPICTCQGFVTNLANTKID